MNNTLIYLWIDPLIQNHDKGKGKIYFNLVVYGDYTSMELYELEDFISGKTLQEVMDIADIQENWNFGIASVCATREAPSISFALSPEQEAEIKAKKAKENADKKEDKRIAKIINSDQPLTITNKEIEICDNGMLKVNIPSLKVNQTIDFPLIWESLEKHIIGKINEDDRITLTDDNGNKIFEIIGGSFLNVANADLTVHNPNLSNNDSEMDIYSRANTQKGGLYVRKDGNIDIGDIDRTFYLQIFTNNLLKQSLKINKPMTELFNQKLLQNND